MYWKKRRISLLFFLLVLLFPNFLWAIEGNLKSFLYIDFVKSSDLSWVVIDPKPAQNHMIEWQIFSNSAKKQLSEDVYNKLKERVIESVWIDFESLKSVGLNPRFEASSLNVIIKSDFSSLKANTLSVADYRAKSMSGGTIEPNFFSSYLNVRFFQNFISSDNPTDLDEKSESLNLNFEHVLNLGGFVLENRVLYQDFEDPLEQEEQTYRDYSRIVYDDEKNLVRYTLGDLMYPVTNYQTVFETGGVSISKTFEINPLFLRSNFRQNEIYLHNPSIVEVYVNGRLQERKHFGRGKVNVQDFPFLNGENEVEIKVINQFGQEESTSFNALSDIRLLAKGISEYSFNVGLLRNLDSQTYRRQNELFSKDDYSNDQWVTSNFYRLGLANNFAAGLNYQATFNKDQLSGAEAIYGTSFGISALEFAHFQNADTNEEGAAVLFDHQSNVLTNGKLNDLRYTLKAEHRSREFRTPRRDTLFVNPLKLSLDGAFGQNFIRNLRGSFGFNYVDFHEGRTSYYVVTNFGWTPRNNINITVNSRVNVNDLNDSTVFLSLNWFQPKKRQQYVVNYRPVEKTLSTTYSIDPILSYHTLRTIASFEANDSQNNYRASAIYQNQRLDLQVNHVTSIDSDNNDQRHTTNVAGGVALAMAGSAFAVSRPIQNSFALFSAKNRPSGSPIALNRFNQHQRGEQNMFGPAVIADLTPYYKDYINLNSNALPPGYSLEKDNFVFRSRYKSGVAVSTKVQGKNSLYGTLFNEETKKPFVYASGVLVYRVDGATRRIPFFTDDKGVFFIENVDVGTYELILDGVEKVIQFNVKEKTKDSLMPAGDIFY